MYIYIYTYVYMCVLSHSQAQDEGCESLLTYDEICHVQVLDHAQRHARVLIWTPEKAQTKYAVAQGTLALPN